ncbi:hypothetical protein CEUSTIGMA_g10846.t1 [Chlamydomonas eustigma]|uniref:Protein kinase domain-containing protein n=1 Tax=Chlamydomonas eustigma TaxID=1157962 RepID=A0A250XK06_9CHLO|nr:hypothetical protein CEUSTIGMA_g10846.t1 [Chlamydomonas eustigma]|eukprot:GAX83421.1 hypothetical protein CEUSTIGMA_g10846.t1 [Chlamydomonas eustigma]
MGNKFSISMGDDAFVMEEGTKMKKNLLPEQQHRYKFGHVLHSMSDGQRRMATNNATGKKYCMHRICKGDKADLKAFHKEVEIMRLFIGHPCVVQLVEVYEDTFNHIHLITELCEGNLIDRFIKNGYYTEDQAQEAARTLLETVDYCHAMGVIIRDIKPENILLKKTNTENASIKIGNLGNAYSVPGSKSAIKIAEHHVEMEAHGGLPHDAACVCEDDFYVSSFYPAPEVLTLHRCGRESDVWSLGMVLYMALSGRAPFYEAHKENVQDEILSRDLSFTSPAWDDISEAAKDFILKATVKDYRLRATISELLAHPWLSTGSPLNPKPLA